MVIIRPLNDELQKIAIEELNENPEMIPDYIEQLREWAEKQQHLTVRTDAQHLVNLLRGCKYDVEKVKYKIEVMCTTKTAYPEIFSNRDPLLPELHEFIDYGVCLPLIKTAYPGSPRVWLFRFPTHDLLSKLKPKLVLKGLLMIKELLGHEDDNFIVAGDQAIYDCKNATLSCVKVLSPGFVKMGYTAVHDAFTHFPKGNYAVNVPKIGAVTYNNVIRHFLRPEHEKLVKLYAENSPKELLDLVGAPVLPPEYGGEGDSVNVLKVYWKKKLESYRDWFIDSEQYRADETKRTKKSFMRWFTSASSSE